MSEAPAREIALVGFSEKSRDKAPYGDAGWEIWGCNHLYPVIPRWDRWFELHSPTFLASAANMDPRVWAEYESWLVKDHGRPLYMQDRYERYPASVRYPIEQAMEVFGAASHDNPWTNTISYMIALAILEKPAQIGLWGVDMIHDTERKNPPEKADYATQRSGVTYLIGLARGMGIPFFVPPESKVLANPLRYGYDEMPAILDEMILEHVRRAKEATAKVAEAQQREQQAMADRLTWDGVRQENQLWIERGYDLKRRGLVA